MKHQVGFKPWGFWSAVKLLGPETLTTVCPSLKFRGVQMLSLVGGRHQDKYEFHFLWEDGREGGSCSPKSNQALLPIKFCLQFIFSQPIRFSQVVRL